MINERIFQEAIAGAHQNPVALDVWKRFRGRVFVQDAVQLP
jgi:hypothetical protein